MKMKIAFRGCLYESVSDELILVDGVSRSKYNSQGRLIHPTEEGIINFWKWFGDSKVVDSNKRPLVLYHGTGGSFDSFDVNRNNGKGHKTGVFFSSSPDVASTYSRGVDGGNVVPAYLKITHPVVLDVKNSNWNGFKGSHKVETPSMLMKNSKEDDELAFDLFGEKPSKPTMVKGSKIPLKKVFPGEMDYSDDYATTDDMARWARGKGYSNIIIKNVVDNGPFGVYSNDESNKPHTIYVVFDATLIKSAVGNKGEYSSTSNIVDESITPLKPKKVLTKRGVGNAGSNTAYKRYFKEFTTSKGNLVKVFFREEFDGIKVDFAVNDSYDDTGVVDSEILRGVLYVVKKYVSQVNPNIISMSINNEDGKRDSRHRVFTSIVTKNMPEYEIYPQNGKYNILLQKKK